MAQPNDLLKARLDELACVYHTQEPMSRHTTFHIGGPADFLIEPESEKQITQILRICRELEIGVHVIGNGSNLLVRDEGIKGAVILLGDRFSACRREGEYLFAQAGVQLMKLCRLAQKEGMSGLEFAYGIPGSVGGGVYMNAGAYGGELKDVVERVRYLDDDLQLQERVIQPEDFSYRDSLFQKNGYLVTGAWFRLSQREPEAIDQEMKEIYARRVEKQPLHQPSAGSTFKRPAGAYAAALIDECGLKGMHVGDALVSEKHAGFVVNAGQATCADVLRLTEQIRQIVYERTGYDLELEIRVL